LYSIVFTSQVEHNNNNNNNNIIMKLPPKTLHNRNKDFDDVSDLTMNFHPKNFTSNNNGDDEASSEGYDEARSEVMSDTSSIYSEGAGSNVGSGMGGKKRSKNKLSKYLKRAVGGKGSGSVNKQTRAASTAASGGVKSDTAVVSNSGGSITSSGGGGGGNTPQVNNNMRKTVADQMVANMFSNSSGKGIERAKSWKAETMNNSEHSMEYSSLSNTKSESVTKLTALGYRSEAVGAAAMAVEFGYTPVGNGGVGRGEGGSGDGGVRRGSADSEPTPSISSPMKRGGGGSGVMLNRRSTVAEGDCKFMFLMTCTFIFCPNIPLSHSHTHSLSPHILIILLCSVTKQKYGYSIRS
jgi:hypothetical protein